MKERSDAFNLAVRRMLRLGIVSSLAVLGTTVLGQTIPNPSFEEDSFGTFPGYISGNTAITGWTGAPANRVGLNPGGGSPFADNGTVPSGNNVAFIQSNQDDPSTPSSLTTTIDGLTPGQTYKVTFKANARNGNTPTLGVFIDGVGVLLPGGPEYLATASVGGSNPYWQVAFEFQAAAASQTLSIANNADGDQTLVVDDFHIAPSTGTFVVAPWTGDTDSGVDASYFYTHAYSFGTGNSTVINGVTFTGAAGGNPGVAGRFSTTFLGNVFGGDANNITTVGDGSSSLATDFVYGGNVPAGLFQSITMQGLTPGTEYVATVYSMAWEDPATGSRWATFSMGGEALTVNQDQYGDNNGIMISHRYTADASGTATLRFAPLVPANVSFHVYGFSNREAKSRDVLPVISSSPQSTIVSPGLDVTFKVTASGVPAPTLQWRYNGANIQGATDTSYTVTASSATAGTYDVVASNRAGSSHSDPATLAVGIPMENSSFEADVFDSWPGYVSGNFPITAWETLGGHGINPVSNGSGPFADNGSIPHGGHVAFLQADGKMSQTVHGLTPGAEYYVHYYENARTGPTYPAIEVTVGGVTVLPAHSVAPVNSGNAYYSVSSSVFKADAADLELAFIKSAPSGGDCTALIDNVAIIPVAAGTKPWIAAQPKPATAYIGESASFSVGALGSLPLSFQWQLNGKDIDGATSSTLQLASVKLADQGDYTVVVQNGSGSATSAAASLTLLETITTLYNTGVDDGWIPVAGGEKDPHYTLLVNPDGGTTDVIVGTEAWPIGSAWSANDNKSKWVGTRAALGAGDIPVGDYLYRTTFSLKGRDPSTVRIVGRWQTDNSGTVILVNGTPLNVPQSGSFSAWTTFTITSSDVTFLAGTNTIDFGVNNAGTPGPSGVRIEFTSTSARTLPSVEPTIGMEPVGGEVAEGETVKLSTTASGTLPLNYQWRKDGNDLPGQTGQDLVLTAVTSADSGKYSVKVSNPWGEAFSKEAVLSVVLRPIAGIFGTGVGLNGVVLGDGEVDPHYILTVSADEAYPGPDAVAITNAWPIQAGVWLPNSATSRWIAPSADQRADVDSTRGNAEGDYVYRTTVNLTGYDVTKVRLVGGWAVDNGGTDILVNGESTGFTTPSFAGLASFTITNGLVAGVNTIDFLVNNLPTSPNPTGLRVDLKGYLYLGGGASKPVLTLTATGGNLTVTWTPVAAGQQLQSAATVNGPWTKVDGAASPYTTSASGAARFFRVVTP